MAPWCNNGEHARSLFRDSKLMETILEVDVSEDGIVGNAVYVKSNIRKWPMVGNDILVRFGNLNHHKYEHMGEWPLRQQ